MSVDRVIDLMFAVRLEAGSHPFVLFVAAFVIVSVADKLGRRRERHVAPPFQSGIWLAGGAIAAYAALIIWYVIQRQYADPAEPTIASVAWLFKAGQPIYHAADSAERYVHIYGPLAFIVPAWSLSLLGPGIITSKIPGAVAGLLSVAVVFALARTAVNQRRALVLAGVFAGICLMFRGVSFWNRPDSLMILVSGGSLLIVVSMRHTVTAAIGLGLAAGVLIDLKITGPLYALPAFAILIAESRITTAVAAVLIAVFVAALPFAFGNVSLANYLHWLSVSAGNGLVFSTFRQNVEAALFLFIPLALGFMACTARRRDRWLAGGLGAGIAMIVIAASKPGAGAYHLLPFVPAVLYGVAAVCVPSSTVVDRSGHVQRGVIAFTLAVGIIAALQSAYFVFLASRTHGMPVAEDLEAFVQAHPDGRIEMGYSSENEPFSFVRPLLAFRQGAYLLDAPAIQEFQMSGIDLPAATVRAVETCAADLWLIPRGGTPFSLRNRYPSSGQVPLFPESLRSAFDRSYRKVTSTKYFDVWACR